MDMGNESGRAAGAEKKPGASMQNWLAYLQSHKKILAEGNNVNLMLYYVIGAFFVISLLVLVFYSKYLLPAMFGLVISVILLAINSYTRASTEKMIMDIDGIILKILMGELATSMEILNEMQKVFKKKKGD